MLWPGQGIQDPRAARSLKMLAKCETVLQPWQRSLTKLLRQRREAQNEWWQEAAVSVVLLLDNARCLWKV